MPCPRPPLNVRLTKGLWTLVAWLAFMFMLAGGAGASSSAASLEVWRTLTDWPQCLWPGGGE